MSNLTLTIMHNREKNHLHHDNFDFSWQLSCCFMSVQAAILAVLSTGTKDERVDGVDAFNKSFLKDAHPSHFDIFIEETTEGSLIRFGEQVVNDVKFYVPYAEVFSEKVLQVTSDEKTISNMVNQCLRRNEIILPFVFISGQKDFLNLEYIRQCRKRTPSVIPDKILHTKEFYNE